MGGGGSAPKPDRNIGRAALKSAEVGEEMFSWMKGRSRTTDAWAREDRSRYKSIFQPLENQMVREAGQYDTAARRRSVADAAAADVRIAAGNAASARRRQAAAMGVDPRSGAYAAADARAGIDSALGQAGARNVARRQVEQEGYRRMGDAVNAGRGFAVNPATSYGMGTNAGMAGGQAAMQGYGQQGNLLNQDYQNRMQAWEAGQSQAGMMGQALGTAAGAILFSDPDAKEKVRKRPGSSLDALKAMPVKEWSYKGDRERHVGPMADDYAKATGEGDGSSINVVDIIGHTVGAIQELSDKVDGLATRKRPQRERAAA